jgi:hypothetical protein
LCSFLGNIVTLKALRYKPTNNMKKLLSLLPEIFFISMASYWINDNYSASGSVNYFAIAIIAVMMYQIIFRKKIVGLVSGIVLAAFSFFMVLAVRSEHNDFPAGSTEGLKFLILGEGLFLLCALIAGAMIFKFAMQKPQALSAQYSVS